MHYDSGSKNVKSMTLGCHVTPGGLLLRTAITVHGCRCDRLSPSCPVMLRLVNGSDLARQFYESIVTPLLAEFEGGIAYAAGGLDRVGRLGLR